MYTVQRDYSGNWDTLKNCKHYIEDICSLVESGLYQKMFLLIYIFLPESSQPWPP